METGAKIHFRAVESMESSVGRVSRWCFPQIKDYASLSFWEMRTQNYAGKWKVLKMWIASEKRAICLSLSATQIYNWATSNCDFSWGDKLRNAEMKTSYGISNGKHCYEAWMKNWFNWFPISGLLVIIKLFGKLIDNLNYYYYHLICIWKVWKV